MDEFERASLSLRRAGSVFVLTGSGISQESGLPTFRGVNGLWHTHRVEELASPEGFARDPVLVWTWYNERRAAHRDARPNAGHVAIARLEACVAGFTLATQNVDSLHLRAGSKNVLELHGHLRAARCDRCDARRPLDGELPAGEIAHGCGGRFRPDIVWFGEPLPEKVWARAAAAAASADVILVVGTSGVVEPAASLATRAPRRDAFVIEVNPEETAITWRANAVLRGPSATILPKLVGRLSPSVAAPSGCVETVAGTSGSCAPT
jgi:NAD-dependent deacetylase